MAADAFHKQVEDEMRKKKNVLDFRDFRDCINARGIALEMLLEDFYDFKSKLSKGKDTCMLSILRRCCCHQIRDSRFYRYVLENRYASDRISVWRVFAKKKFIKVWQNFEVFQRKPSPRGIPLRKVDCTLSIFNDH